MIQEHKSDSGADIVHCPSNASDWTLQRLAIQEIIELLVIMGRRDEKERINMRPTSRKSPRIFFTTKKKEDFIRADIFLFINNVL